MRDVEKELLPMADHFGLGILPYFPLASGLLTGKYKQDASIPEGTRFATSKGLADRYMTEANWNRVQKLEAFASERGHSILELAFSWLLSKPVVSSVIAGATKTGQVDQNVGAGDWRLSSDELASIDELLK